jgi:hypothetical protein
MGGGTEESDRITDLPPKTPPCSALEIVGIRQRMLFSFLAPSDIPYVWYGRFSCRHRLFVEDALFGD